MERSVARLHRARDVRPPPPTARPFNAAAVLSSLRVTDRFSLSLSRDCRSGHVTPLAPGACTKERGARRNFQILERTRRDYSSVKEKREEETWRETDSIIKNDRKLTDRIRSARGSGKVRIRLSRDRPVRNTATNGSYLSSIMAHDETSRCLPTGRQTFQVHSAS